VRKLHIHKSATAEINPQGQAMPEKHREDSRRAEDQRKGDEIPFLAEEIYVGALKKFHSA
jgi:hypothetical protein